MNRFQIKIYYTLIEAINILYAEEGGDIMKYHFTAEDILDIMSGVNLEPSSNPLKYEIIEQLKNSSPKYVVELFNRIVERFQDHYTGAGDREYDFEHGDDISGIGYDVFKPVASMFRIMEYTYLKYSTLLDLYETQKEHLLDKLETSDIEDHITSQQENHSENGTDGDITKINDTPQIEDVEAEFEEDQYVSELHKRQGSHSSSGASGVSGTATITRTHSSDPATIMERLNEVQNKFSNTWLKWLNEFDNLFIEEGNIEL